MKTLITILAFFYLNISFGQNSIFRGEIYSDNSKTLNGTVIFPLLKDTVKLDTNGLATIDLKNKNLRIFYFIWSGWKSKIFKFQNGICNDTAYKIFVPDTLFYKSFQNSKTCPICKQGKYLIPIVYGLPSPRLFKKAEDRKVILGGCFIYDWNPVWHCSKDEFEF